MIRKPPPRGRTAPPTTIGKSIPAPVGGWNAISPLAAMDPKDAVILDNWIPRAAYVELRRGSLAWAIGATAPVESLLIWRGAASGNDEMFAVSDGDIYDVTAQDSGFAPAVYSVASNRVQYVNFANDGGAFLICVNGADDPFRYNGTAFSNLTITGSSGSVTLTASDLNDVMSHKRRLFFTEKESLRVWFLDVLAIQGTASLLDLGSVFQQGGTLTGLATWSLDGGQGQDDYAVFLTDQGEVAIYQGTDPANADEWALVGVFSIGVPLGKRALFKYGGDLNVLTTSGVLPLSQALSRDRAQDETVAITAKIQNAFSVSAQNYRSNFGWEGLTYQKGTLAIYNIPVDELTESVQYVQNIQTGAWCRFTGLNAFCWAIKDNDIFFGGTDGVYQWDTGVTDNGEDLTADLKSAFNYFGDRGRQKRFTMLRPTLNATASVSPAIEMLTDYQERDPVAVPTTIVSSDPALVIRDNWTSVTGVGYCGSVRMQVKMAVDPDGFSYLVDADEAPDEIDIGDGDVVVTATGDVLEAQIQVLAFNIQYQPGGPL